jgi:hypothetical protein
MQILVRDRLITVSTDRVKPAYILNETARGTTTMTFNPGHSTTCRATTVRRTNYTLLTPRTFPFSLQQLSNHLRGGMNWKPPTVNRALANHKLATNQC